MASSIKGNGINETWIGRFRDEAARRRSHGEGWFDAAREQAFSVFETAGLPTTRSESFRFTNLAPLGKVDFLSAAERGGSDSVSARVDSYRLGTELAAELVFINGRLSREHSRTGSLPKGVVVDSLAEAMEKHRATVEAHLGRYADICENSLTALNTALLEDGLFLHVPEGCRVEKPVHAIFLSCSEEGPVVTHPRNLYVAEKGSGVTIIETYAGNGKVPYWTNAVSEAVVAESAVMTHYKQQEESRHSFHVATTTADQAKSSRFSSFSLSFGGRLARNDIRLHLGGEECDGEMNGVYIADGERLVDHHTVVNHARPRCESRELYKGILMGRSRGVFNGKIVVHQDAQQTNAFQANRNLLLSDDAAINTQPQLEILADDVRCSHGATVGQLDEEALFYFRSRGIDRKRATEMLIHAFAGEVVEKIDFEPLRDRVGKRLRECLGAGESAGGK